MKKIIYNILILLVAFSLNGYTQAIEITLTGTIKDNINGESIFGAIVHVEGTSKTVTTDENGNFTLSTKTSLPLTLVVYSFGYEKQEIFLENTSEPLSIQLIQITNDLGEVVVTARRKKESSQEIPIPITIVGGALVAETGAFNVNRLKELVPSVQLYTSNPRNTTLNIRGLGSTFGLTNDGIDPGVGFYVDGVFYARPAATTLDFIDVEQVEVLRGPQGTLFGKNTTAGAFNITTRKPSFTPGANYELSYGNYGYIQAKSSITGALGKKVAARLSFSGTQRDGLIYNVATQKYVNDINNIGARAQFLYTPKKKTNIILAADASRQRPDGYAQVVAGVAPTLRAAYRQYDQIAADLGYALPSTNPFDRKIDHDTPWRSNQDLGGVSLNIETGLGSGTLTSTSAWRYWKWDPSNDRDYTGMNALNLSQAPSKHQQLSQEIRWNGSLSNKLNAVIGVFAFAQNLKTDPYHTEESGTDQWRFAKSSTSALWQTPGLFDGYGIRTHSNLNTFSAAVFSQFDWTINKRLHILPGIRFNYDEKSVDFKRETYGGLETTDPALLALKKQVYSNQEFNKYAADYNLSGQLTISYKASKAINTFITGSTGYKPIGLNLGGIPTDANGPLLDLAVIKPEQVYHLEFGVKTTPSKNSTLNLTAYNTIINDYQTLVQSPDPGVNRGYLANAERVQVRGIELEGNVNVKKFLSVYGGLAFTDGKYIKFSNAPLPLEETGLKVDGVSVYYKDISGSELPGISKWAGSLGAEASTAGKFLGRTGRYFIALDTYGRTEFSSSATPSKYLRVDSYALLNGRLGFRVSKDASVFVWGRNLLNKNYFEQLLPAGGNAGQYAGVLGDQRTYGITIRQSF